MMKKFFLAFMLVTFTIVGLLLPTSNAYAQTVNQPAPAEIKHIRYSVFTPQGQRNLEILEQAVKKMKELACTNPHSWYYQSAIHWVPGLHYADKDGNYFFQNNIDCPQYSLNTLKISDTELSIKQREARQELEKLLAVWQRCTHDRVDFNLILRNENQKTATHFLTWHRIYLANFEKIVRKISGEPGFTLPYWDYTNPETAKTPPSFTEKTSPLYTKLRRTNINEWVDGKEPGLEVNQQEKIRKDKNNAYESVFFNSNAAPKIGKGQFTHRELEKLAEFAKLFTAEAFSYNIEASPHDDQHRYIGGDSTERNPVWNGQPSPRGRGILSDVGTAAFDPIFWVHHAAIDYYWESWTQVTGIKAKPTDIPLYDYIKPLYRFSDGNGNQVQYNSSEDIIKAVYNVDFQYDNIDPDALESAPKPEQVKKYQQNAQEEADFINKYIKDPNPETSERFVVGSVTDNPQKLIPQNVHKLTRITVPVSQVGSDSSSSSVKRLKRLKRYALQIEVSFNPQNCGGVTEPPCLTTPNDTYSVYLKSNKEKDIPKIIRNIKDYYIGTLGFLHDGQDGKWTFHIDVTDNVKNALKIAGSDSVDIVFVSDKAQPKDNIILEALRLYYL